MQEQCNIITFFAKKGNFKSKLINYLKYFHFIVVILFYTWSGMNISFTCDTAQNEQKQCWNALVYLHLSACNETNYPLIDGVTFHAVISSILEVYDTWNPPSTKKEWNTFRRVDIIIYLFFQELLIFQVRIRKIVQQENITRNKIENLGKCFFVRELPKNFEASPDLLKSIWQTIK